ncbi:histidine kinase-like protein [Streptomyces sp. TLI_235]|nr:ATP-binding protein [Streptomyces sp. TLI_235]PBC76083.1 histidine kinase-like protein [Streptomyces sp. TLI_235]
MAKGFVPVGQAGGAVLARPAAARRRCFPGGAGDVRAGRVFTTRVLGEWGRPGGEEFRADTLLVVSELLSNGLLHAGGPVELTLRRNWPTIRVEVFDTGPGSPEPHDPRESGRPGGRGLHIVDRLSTDWGVVRHRHGKTVWADLRLAGRSRPDPNRSHRTQN